MSRGYLSLVLHAHLPFVRHPENSFHLEELWLFEALAECYLPLLGVLDRLEQDDVPGRITVSFSAPLIAMLDDELLRDRFTQHLERTLVLCERERERTAGQPAFEALAQMYQARYQALLERYTKTYRRDVLGRFAHHHANKRCELITAVGSHAILPLMQSERSQRAHILAARGEFVERFGFPPRGVWLPECAFAPGVDDLLAGAGIQYTIVDTHALQLASAAPVRGTFAPITAPGGTSFFARDPRSSKVVWSASEGYPGDFDYREFYRDVGFDLPMDYIRPFIHPDGIRIHTGLKYHRVTGPMDDKAPYIAERAVAKTREHARDFVQGRLAQVDEQARARPNDPPPLLVCPYDAELFGHWWFEGPLFLEAVLRELAAQGGDLQAVSLGDYLDAHPVHQLAVPGFSSWGDGGYLSVWLDSGNDWLYRHLHRAESRMITLANHFPEARGYRRRALDLAARALMLAQASDWAFIIKTGTSVEYALQRVRAHLEQFNALDDMLVNDRLDEEAIDELSTRLRILSSIDYHLFEGPFCEPSALEEG